MTKEYAKPATPRKRKPRPGSARATFWQARLAREQAEKAKEATDEHVSDG